MRVSLSKVSDHLSTLWQCLGIASDSTSHAEKLISSLGAAIGVLIVYGALCFYSLDHALVLLVASVAASAVLVFAVPHGALSQPWPVVGSYLVSGFIGVSSHRWIDSSALSAAVAVGLSVSAMHYMRCLHPPGGAVALIAVTGGPEIQALGYGFVIAPALINAATLVCAGIFYNCLFPWRRYPVHILYLKPHKHPLIRKHHLVELAHDDYQYALKKLDSFIDINPQDLVELVECAREHALMNQKPQPNDNKTRRGV